MFLFALKNKCSSRMCTARLPTMFVAAATRCQYPGGVGMHPHWTYPPPPPEHTHSPGRVLRPFVPTPPPKGPGTRDTTPSPRRDLGPEIPTPWKEHGTRDTHSRSPWTDTRLRKQYLPPTSLAGGNNNGAHPCPAVNL